MSQTVTLHLPDTIYTAIHQAAQASGQSLDEWIVAHLPELLPPPAAQADAAQEVADVAEDYPAWLTAEQRAEWEALEAAIEAELAEWAALEARIAAERRNPPTPEEAHAFIEQVFAGGRRFQLTEEESLELAMSDEWSEWNLHL